MSQVFISYARSDEPQAQAVEESLIAMGYSVWRDKQLPLHRPYQPVIEEELRAAKAVVVIWSHDAVASDWVRAEADLARQEKKLVQVSVDAIIPPMPFNQIECDDLSGWNGDPESAVWRKLVRSLAQLSPPSPPAAEATPTDASALLLAVLPFDNLSPDADLLYFSDGVSEEILHTVSRIDDIKVIGRSSAFQFRGADKAAHHVAKELNCSHVLDGSVRRGGQRIRVSAQLIECATQTTLWTDRFDRDLVDVFTLQDEIASAVADALRLVFAPASVASAIDPVAYDLYLRARTTTQQWLGAYDGDLLEQALARAPNFAQAWAALAMTRGVEAHLAHDPAVSAPLRARSLEAVQKTLALQPNSGPAYAALSLAEPMCGRFAEREALINKALADSPHDPMVLLWAYRWSREVGRSREAFGYMERAHQAEPLWPQGANQYATSLNQIGLEAEGAKVFDEAFARWPELDYLTTNALSQAAERRDWDRVDQLIERLKSLNPPVPGTDDYIAQTQRLRHWTDEWTERLRGSLQREFARTGTLGLNRLNRAWEVGLADEVYALIDQASFAHLFKPDGRLSEGEVGLHLLFALHGGALRSDIRFVGLCAKLGLCGYWAQSNSWPDCADQVPYDFKAECSRLAAEPG